jgi:hypothetical protein
VDSARCQRVSSPQEIAWSFEAVFHGVHPARDSSGNEWTAGSVERNLAGKPLAGGWRGVLWILRGNLEYFANSLGLERFASNSPCFLCHADCLEDGAPWTDPRPSARWRATLWHKDVSQAA